MKFRTTAKAIRYGYQSIMSVGSYAMSNLLRFRSPVAYTCGVYGWNFDVYEVDGVAICTGYRGMPGKSPDYSMLKEYEHRAEEIYCDRSVPYEERAEEVERLLSEFVRKATERGK